jgi:hypothetical protein
MAQNLNIFSSSYKALAYHCSSAQFNVGAICNSTLFFYYFIEPKNNLFHIKFKKLLYNKSKEQVNSKQTSQFMIFKATYALEVGYIMIIIGKS